MPSIAPTVHGRSRSLAQVAIRQDAEICPLLKGVTSSQSEIDSRIRRELNIVLLPCRRLYEEIGRNTRCFKDYFGGKRMQKVHAWTIAVPLILISFGFILVGAIGYSMSPEWLTAEQIREQARKAVAEPAYPPPPAGRSATQQNTRQVCTQVPKVERAFPPSISMQNVCTNVSDPVVSIVGPSTDETREWQAKVTSMRTAYETAVDQEAARLSERQRSDL
jgi:hypothetical protein